MIHSFIHYTNENNIEHNKNCPYVPDPPYQVLIIGGSGSRKTNILLNLIKEQPDIDKIYLYAKDSYEPKYQFLINKRESTGLKHFDDPNDMYDVYKKIDEYNSIMITDMINNKKLNSIETELFIRGIKLNISLVFITQPYFKVQKDVQLNATHFFLTKIPNKRELHGIALSYFSDIDPKKFMKIYRECTKTTIFFFG